MKLTTHTYLMPKVIMSVPVAIPTLLFAFVVYRSITLPFNIDTTLTATLK